MSHPLLYFYPALNVTQQWTGTHFTLVSLKDLGAVFRLGHTRNSLCSIPSPQTTLTIFDITGVHAISITYCECNPDESTIPSFIQLLRARWFPATWRRPSTTFTFRLLNFLHKLHSNCKVNLYDFHATITTVSDNAGLRKPVVSPSLTCLHTQLTCIPYSSDTMNYPLYSASMCSCANSDEPDVGISWAASLPFRREA